jgi:hypothetical protein
MLVGELYGMQTFDQSLVQLYRNGLVERADAVAHASAPGEMRFALDRADLERERAAVAPAPPARPAPPAPPDRPPAASSAPPPPAAAPVPAAPAPTVEATPTATASAG